MKKASVQSQTIQCITSRTMRFIYPPSTPFGLPSGTVRQSLTFIIAIGDSFFSVVNNIVCAKKNCWNPYDNKLYIISTNCHLYTGPEFEVRQIFTPIIFLFRICLEGSKHTSSSAQAIFKIHFIIYRIQKILYNYYE